MTREERARQTIDQLLTAAGWAVQDFKSADSELCFQRRDGGRTPASERQGTAAFGNRL